MVQQSMISLLAEGQTDFMCSWAEFASAMTLINLCTKVASQPPQSSLPAPNLALINQKIDTILSNQKTFMLSAPTSRATAPHPPSFADIAKCGPQNSPGPNVFQPKTPVSLPPKIPSFIIKQFIPLVPVKLKTGAEVLSARINKALESMCQVEDFPVFNIRAMSVNQRSGKLLVQLKNAADAAFAT